MTSRHFVVNKYFAFFLIDFFEGLRNCKQHISQRGGLSQTPQPVFTDTKANDSVGQMTVSYHAPQRCVWNGPQRMGSDHYNTSI